MYLLNFRTGANRDSQFGVVINDCAVSFRTLKRAFPRVRANFTDIVSYLRYHPESEKQAHELYSRGREQRSQIPPEEIFPLAQIKILLPVPHPPALFDFALSPLHLKNSTQTLIDHEIRRPFNILLKGLVERAYRKFKSKLDFKYYKGNQQAIIGPDDSPWWPNFTSYLDIEPELSVVIGRHRLNMPDREITDPIAGYTIFNDFSARDVQWPEMFGFLGPMRSKDFECGNGIGPFLVTPDEIPDPRSLSVSVKVGGRYQWRGSTREYMCPPQDVIGFLSGFRSLAPGTIIAMGTVPGCCGLDRDEWLHPGDLVEITFERLGTLRQLIPADIGPLQPSRWRPRPELNSFYQK